MKIFKNERELQEDLAQYLRSVGLLTFTEISIPNLANARADIIAVKPYLYSNKDIRIYEVKNNRNTFLNDQKYEKYMDCCKRMYLAAPKGVIKKEEVPNDVGLIVRGENGWRVVKAAKNNLKPEKIDADFVWGLLYRGYEESKIERRLRDRIIAEDNVTLKKQAKKIGHELGRVISRNKQAKVEDWIKECSGLFYEYLGIEASYDKLPSIFDIKELLKSVKAATEDIIHLRAIGEYLVNLDLPEAREGTSNTRESKRKKAMEFNS